MDPGADKNLKLDLSPGIDTSPLVSIKANGYARVLSGSWGNTSARVENAGEFTLMPGTSAAFKAAINDGADKFDFIQTSGVTNLYAGSLLKGVRNDIKLSGGTLITRPDPDDTSFLTGSHEATIQTGKLFVTGGDVRMGGMDVGTFDDPHHFGTLKVNGMVIWTGGVYRPVVLGSRDGGLADKWYATGSFVVGPDAVLAPGSIDDEAIEAAPPEANYRWLILQSDVGIALSGNPPAVQGGWCVLEQIAEPNGVVKNWKLKSVVN